jgi:leukocyte immunoglobulin-like receptor
MLIVSFIYRITQQGKKTTMTPTSMALLCLGVYSKPSLSVLPSAVVTTGANVILQCGLWLGFGSFLLTKEREPMLSWTQESQRHSSGELQALFSMGLISPGHR